MHYGKCSALHYGSGHEDDNDDEAQQAPEEEEQVGRRTSTSSKATRFGPEGNRSRSPRRADQLQRQGLINLDADDNYRVTEKKRLSTFSVGS
jgi:hypothetical protein